MSSAAYGQAGGRGRCPSRGIPTQHPHSAHSPSSLPVLAPMPDLGDVGDWDSSKVYCTQIQETPSPSPSSLPQPHTFWAQALRLCQYQVIQEPRPREVVEGEMGRVRWGLGTKESRI